MATERPLEQVSNTEVSNGTNGRGYPNRSAFDPALTVEEVAERLKISPATVYALLRAGALTSYKVGRSWRIDELDLVKYIERQKARHGAELHGVAIAESSNNRRTGSGEASQPE
ncbi:MAG: helix-turn-helix domain-containing protein [Chloroflexota bacterium]|nr:helix-turn-helix domain-containing protein [Chloroflexota bacterium]